MLHSTHKFKDDYKDCSVVGRDSIDHNPKQQHTFGGILILAIEPHGEKKSRSSSSVVMNGRFPTNTVRAFAAAFKSSCD